MDQAAQGSGGVPILGGVQKTCRYCTSGHGLGGKVVWGWQLDLMIIESENHRIIGWKRPLRSSSPTIHPTPPCLLNHVLKFHIYMFFEHLQGWGLNYLMTLEIFSNLNDSMILWQTLCRHNSLPRASGDKLTQRFSHSRAELSQFL